MVASCPTPHPPNLLLLCFHHPVTPPCHCYFSSNPANFFLSFPSVSLLILPSNPASSFLCPFYQLLFLSCLSTLSVLPHPASITLPLLSMLFSPCQYLILYLYNPAISHAVPCQSVLFLPVTTPFSSLSLHSVTSPCQITFMESKSNEFIALIFSYICSCFSLLCFS